MGKNRFYYLCAVLGCFGFYIAYREWLSWLLLVGVLGLPWLSLLVSLPMLRLFRIRVEAPARLRMGEEGQLRLVPEERPLVPPYRGKIRLERTVTKENWQCEDGAKVPSDHCGGIHAVPEKIYVYDALGLFRFRVKQGEGAWTLVEPKPVVRDRIPDLNRYLAGAWRPKAGGGYSENHELREYRPGDSLNQIHWKLTAKTGKMTIREPMEPDRGLVLLTLDISGPAEVLDRKFGELAWLGARLLELGIPFQIRALTGEGVLTCQVSRDYQLRQGLERLLCSTPVEQGSVLDQEFRASWHCHLGGADHEA